MHPPDSSSPSPTPIRVYVTGVGRLTRDILGAFLKQSPAVEVVGLRSSRAGAEGRDSRTDLQGVLADIARLEPDAVVVCVPHETELAGLERLLSGHIVVLAGRGKKGLHAVGAGATPLHDPTVERLLELVESAEPDRGG